MGMMPAQLNKRSLGLLGVVLLFLLLLLQVMYMLKPEGDKVSDQKDQIATLRKQAALLTNKSAEKERDDSRYSDSPVQEALPLSDNTEQLLLDLKDISQSSVVTLQSASFTLSDSNGLQSLLGGEQTPYPTVREIKASVEIAGTYGHLLDWIDALQKLNRLINVDSFVLNQPRLASDLYKPQSVNVNFTAYYDPSYRGLVDHEILPFDATP